MEAATQSRPFAIGVMVVDRPRMLKPAGLKLMVPSRRQQQLDTDQRRGTPTERGYDARWAAASRRVRAERPLCCCCQANGRIVPSALTDHIVPHRGDAALFWDTANWQVLCHRCHNEVKAAVEVRWLKGLAKRSELSLNRLLPEYFG